MVILGVDPGIASVGYGVVSYEKNRFTALEYDTFRTPAGQQLSERLLQIFNFFEQLVRRYPIDAMSVEELFFNTNVSTAIHVGHGRCWQGQRPACPCLSTPPCRSSRPWWATDAPKKSRCSR